MAQPARTVPPREAPPVDPRAVERAYRLERARRRARDERERDRRLAAFRFFAVVLVLTAVAALLLLTAWREIERLFGL
ncbi:MAG TPA: hypothetical protein VD813_12365 [Pseudonocardia sp.]|nr:hypothetical protein [Pseudonocardia sp.]